ncbi:hypothetical protein [Tropicimonas sp. IMCC6043]|uniref:hypothetical protein n=1 Tax=Tropicimonas sp. IMCC6043 TaxID=2510645 RepID=UPI00101B6A66|nr:hypothetical protein [Tropicimonas sp. IMCC6043]RYH06275.1 hypothetical protein EU800_24400 [Tropicimonas sp. IMCC6043]
MQGGFGAPALEAARPRADALPGRQRIGTRRKTTGPDSRSADPTLSFSGKPPDVLGAVSDGYQPIRHIALDYFSGGFADLKVI